MINFWKFHKEIKDILDLCNKFWSYMFDLSAYSMSFSHLSSALVCEQSIEKLKPCEILWKNQLNPTSIVKREDWLFLDLFLLLKKWQSKSFVNYSFLTNNLFIALYNFFVDRWPSMTLNWKTSFVTTFVFIKVLILFASNSVCCVL